MFSLGTWSAAVASLIAIFLQSRVNRENGKAISTNDSKTPYSSDRLRELNRRFFPVFLLLVFGDRLKNGLRTSFDAYLRLGFTTSDAFFLYLVPLLSSASLGPFFGGLADALGRRLMCVVFCVFSLCSTCLQASPMGCFETLMLAKIFDGICLSIMSSAFEAWYVHEYVVQSKLPIAKISHQNASWVLWTTVTAIFALIVELTTLALVDTGAFGPLTYIFALPPFFIDIFVYIAGTFLVGLKWTENSGSEVSKDLHRGRRTQLVMQAIRDAGSAIFRTREIFWLGCVHVAFETGAVILFSVWLSRIGVVVEAPGPFGHLGLEMGTHLIFLMIGCLIYRRQSSSVWSSFGCLPKATAMILASSVMMTFASLQLGYTQVSQNMAHVTTIARTPLEDLGTVGNMVSHMAFLLLGLSMGLYLPSIATARSYVLPNNLRATIMALFRVPVGIISFCVLYFLNIEDEEPYNSTIILWIASVQGILALCSGKMFLAQLGTELKFKYSSI